MAIDFQYIAPVEGMTIMGDIALTLWLKWIVHKLLIIDEHREVETARY